MEGFSLILLAFALAMDAFAVAAASGIRLRHVRKKQALRMAACFGFFQAIMPLAGWILGYTVRDTIEQYDHWVAFFLLLGISLHMLWDIRKPENTCEAPDDFFEDEIKKDPTKGRLLIMLGIATSLDAMAIGLSLSLLKENILFPCIVIGVVTFFVSYAGVYLGVFTCRHPFVSRFATFFGALILIGIGVNILYEHGVFDFHYALNNSSRKSLDYFFA